MRPFDPKTYSREVLAPLKGEKPDRFVRYLLDPADDDDDAIRARLAEVRAYWNNNKTSAGTVGDVIKALLREHGECTALLEDADERSRLRRRLLDDRAQARAAKWTRVDAALEQANRAHGGIPENLRAQIIGIGQRLGLNEDEVASHIAEAMRRNGWKTVELSQVGTVEPLGDARANQIERAVRRFAEAQQYETGNESPVRSLFEALDLQIDADIASCATGIAALEDRLNKQVKRDSDYGAAGRTVVQLAKANLAADEAAAQYRATLMRAVKVALEVDFAAMALDGAIDQQENAQLLRMAAESGLTDTYARGVVDQLFRDSAEAGNPVARVEGERVEIILCAACGNPDALGSGHEQCLRCAQPLFRACEACHRGVPRGEAVCRYCGQSMQRAIQLDAELRDGRQALAAGRPEQAGRHAANVVRIDSDSITGHQLATDSQAAVQRAHMIWSEVREGLGHRRLYAARGALRVLTREGSDVVDAGQFPADVAEQIAAELAAVEQRLAAARIETEPARREHLLAEILSAAADCEAAERALSQLAPGPPTTLSARLVGAEIALRWVASPSPGVTEYVVVRGSQRAPIGPADGTVVAATGSTVATDVGVEAGASVAYAVFARRAGTHSRPATTQPILAAFEAEDVQVAVGSGEVRLSWTLSSARARVEIERSGPSGIAALTAGTDGLIDADVVNGESYSYTVRLRYGEVLTAGVLVTATPAEPPRAISVRELEPVAGGLRIVWPLPPAGFVTIVRSPRSLELSPGTEIRRFDMPGLGALLPGDRGVATDPAPIDGCWYTPATVVGDRAVLGTGMRWSDIPALTDLRIQPDGGGGAVASWSWPPEVRHAVVVWREGGSPAGPSDPEADRVTVARAAQQEVDGGVFRITRTRPQDPLRVAVYGAQMRDGELVLGARLVQSSRASLDPAQSREAISYDVRVKGGMRRSLEFALSGATSFPEVVLVARAGDVMLLKRDEGQQIARLGGDGGPAQVVVPLGSLPKDRPLSVRAFFAADSSQSRFALRDPADLTKLTLR